jgi:hypothetical protein
MLLKVKAQAFDSTWTSYDTSNKINTRRFSPMTKLETDIAKNLPDFTINRARLTLTDSGHLISPRELQKPDFPLLCRCSLKNDTVHITAAFGFMAGLGIIMIVSKDQFGTTFFQEADNTNIFKSTESDSAYADRISVPAERQKLILLRKPTFTKGEAIIGTFEGQFTRFYELDFKTKQPIVRNYKAKLFFTCKLY